MAKELVREGKVEDRLLFMEAEKKLKIEAEKLKKLEDELKQKENQKKLKTGNDHMYKKCTLL